jgi:hypothetical protein
MMGTAPQFTIKRRVMSPLAAAAALAVLLVLYFSLSDRWKIVVLVVPSSAWVVSVLVRMSRARRRPLAIEDGTVVQYAAGREIGRVRLDRPFEVQYLLKGYFAALYRITQGDVILTFADKTPGAEQLVRDILGLEWPPIGRAWI